MSTSNKTQGHNPFKTNQDNIKPVLQSPKPAPRPVKADDATFSKAELEFLLKTIKDSTFKGSELQKVYELTMKIQSLFLKK
jgi:hypothetical protein